jgi:fatty acid desaturase
MGTETDGGDDESPDVPTKSPSAQPDRLAITLQTAIYGGIVGMIFFLAGVSIRFPNGNPVPANTVAFVTVFVVAFAVLGYAAPLLLTLMFVGISLIIILPSLIGPMLHDPRPNDVIALAVIVAVFAPAIVAFLFRKLANPREKRRLFF